MQILFVYNGAFVTPEKLPESCLHEIAPRSATVVVEHCAWSGDDIPRKEGASPPEVFRMLLQPRQVTWNDVAHSKGAFIKGGDSRLRCLQRQVFES